MFSKFLRGVAIGSLVSIVSFGVEAQTVGDDTRMVAEVSKRLGISPNQAKEHLERQHKAGRYRAEIESTESESFAGMYVEHAPKFRVVVRFTGDAADAALRHPTDLPVEAQTANSSLRSLKAIQNETYADLKANNIESSSQISERDGSIDFFVTDPVAAEAVKGKLRHGDKVRFRKATKLSKGEAAVEGGRPLNSGGSLSCTSGFVVYKTGLGNTATRYILTAGHCPNTLTYNGIALPFVGEKYAAYDVNDYQWHTRGAFLQPTNEIYEGLASNLKITAVWPLANMNVGDFICKWGSVTGFTCGNISSLNYNSLGSGGFVRVDGGGVDLSSPGDSGGPWYYDAYGEAWGIHQNDAADNSLDAVFMPVSRISASSLAVLTTP